MDYDVYKDLEQNLEEAVDWSEEVEFSVDREGNDTFLVVSFIEEDEDTGENGSNVRRKVQTSQGGGLK